MAVDLANCYLEKQQTTISLRDLLCCSLKRKAKVSSSSVKDIKEKEQKRVNASCRGTSEMLLKACEMKVNNRLVTCLI